MKGTQVVGVLRIRNPMGLRKNCKDPVARDQNTVSGTVVSGTGGCVRLGHIGGDRRRGWQQQEKKKAAHLYGWCCGLKWQVQTEVRADQSCQGLEGR